MPNVPTTRLGLAQGYDLGENGWKIGYDDNWKQLDGIIPGDFGIKAISGLALTLLGGVLENESAPGSYSVVAGSTVTVGASVTTYIQRNATGAVSTSTGSFTSIYPLFAVTSNINAITSFTDFRYPHGRLMHRVPRLTTAQKTALASPVGGMIVFDTTLNAFSGYDGTAWKTFTVT